MGLSDVSWRPPVLETARLVLRGWEPRDVRAVFAYAADDEVTRFVAFPRARALDDSRAFLDGFVADHYRDGELDYCICDQRDPADALGGMGLYWRSRPHRVMEIGYVLRRSAWGNAFVPEAGRRLIAHAFATTDVERIYAPIFAPNAKSRRAAEKMGLAFEGVLRSAVEHNGRRWDQAIHAIVRGDVRA
jgi:ribosomal-protein-alanine N-acetyltransferase